MATTDFEQNIKSAMVVLQNLELLERILRYHSGYKPTLLSASLTAKAFSEPAFNVLWYQMHSIWPLFRVLPTFERIDGKYVFTGPIRNEHLQRVKYYAKRIRFLAFKGLFDGAYSNVPRVLMLSTFMRMDKLGAFGPLRTIQLHDRSCNTMVFSLTSPNLDSIEIKAEKMGPDELNEIGVASFLQSVASQTPLLRSLVIEGPFTRIALQVVPDFLNLHSLAMRLTDSDIPVHFWKSLVSSMPSLQHLHMHVLGCRLIPTNDRPQRLERPGSISQLPFPSLKTLCVACNLSQLENLLGVLDAPLLTSVALSLIQLHLVPDDDADMYKFFERNRRVLKDKLHRFSIQAFDPSLSLFKSFEKLRDLLFVSWKSVISMSDVADTFNSDGSWSRSLTRLELKQTNSTDPLNSMSIAALYLIADACPSLESLKISIHRPDKPEMRKDEQERKPHSLRNLVFVNLPRGWDDTMSLGIEFVSLLDDVFPCILIPEYTGCATDKRVAPAAREAWWKGVQDMWRMCQTIKGRTKFKQPSSA